MTKLKTHKKPLVPQLRFKEFDGEWERKKLRDILSIGSGRDYKHLKDGDIPVYGTGGLMTYVDQFLYDGESVGIGRKGTIDKPVYFNEKFWTVDTLFYTHSFEKSLPKYVYCLFQKINWKLYNEASGVPSLSKSTIEKIKISIPSLKEQQKIATFLTAVDKKISQLTRKKEQLTQYKKGVMQQLFPSAGSGQVPELRFQPDGSTTSLKQPSLRGAQQRSNLPDENSPSASYENQFPDWEEKRFKEIVISYRLGGNYKNTLEVTNYPLIKMGNLDRGKIKLDKLEYITSNESIDQKDKIEYGDLFFNTRNTLDLVGKAAIWRNELPEAYYNSNLMYIKFENNFFMNYRLNSYEGIKGLKRFATGTTSVAAIYTKDLLKLKLTIPSLKEQQKIASYLSALDDKIEAVQLQIEQMQEFEKGLLQQLFV